MLAGIAHLLGDGWGWSTDELLLGGAPVFWFVSGVAVAVAGRTSALVGGAAALTAVLGPLLVQLVRPAWRLPVRLFVLPTDPVFATSRLWLLGLAAVLLGGAVIERAVRR